jgi:hypothetical protein
MKKVESGVGGVTNFASSTQNNGFSGGFLRSTKKLNVA